MFKISENLTGNAEVDFRIGFSFVRSYNDGQPFLKKIGNKLYAKHYETLQDRSPRYDGPVGQRVEYRLLGLANNYDIDAAIFVSPWDGEIISHEELNITE